MSGRSAGIFGAAVVGVTAVGLGVLSGVGLLDRGAVERPDAEATVRPVRTSASTVAPSPAAESIPAPRTTATVTVTPSTAATPKTPARPPLRYVFPVQGCPASASQAHHDYPAADIFTRHGCRFVAPVDGRVDEVIRVDRWNPRTNLAADRGGLAVSIIGRDGVRYYGSHLSAIAPGIRPGLSVRAGQLLGLTGRTGSARSTPAHLHFGISWPTPAGRWWIRRGTVPPQRFLAGLKAGTPSSPAATVERAETTYGVDRGCRAYC